MPFEWNAAAHDLLASIGKHGMIIIGLVIGGFIAAAIAKLLVVRIVRRLVTRGPYTVGGEEKREDTLIRVISGTLRIIIWICVALMILAEFGVDIGPLIAAVGIAGVAIGFGGQYLIRDLIAGIFFIVENQYRTGDVVCFDETCGAVEDISLRMTTLRDMDGTVHHVPHGEVQRVSNLSKLFSRVNLNVGVSYAAELEKVIAVVDRVGEELAADPVWKEKVITPPAFLRVDEFGDSALIIKILGDTQPSMQWDVTGELRKRLKIAFDKEGIDMPFPQQTVHISGGVPSV